MENNIEKEQIEDDEIDLIEIAKTLWEGRRIIIRSTIICTIIGLFIAIFSPKEYTASTIFVPQNNESRNINGSLGSLAAIAGLNLGNNQSNPEISPSLYQSILESPSFFQDLIKTEINFSNSNIPISISDYYTKNIKPSYFSIVKKYTIGLPKLIINKYTQTIDNSQKTQGSNTFSFNKKEYSIRKSIYKQIKLKLNSDLGYISLECTMPEALAAAEFTRETRILLQKYVTYYRVKKAEDELRFVEDQLETNKDEFLLAEEKLAMYSDKNKNITSAKVQSILQHLRSDYNLKLDIYSELAKQREQAKIKVAQNKPSFNVIQKVTIPHEKSAPRRSLIVIVWGFLGVFFGISIIYLLKGYRVTKERWLN
ncbi:Wzz/FepE/Etk N-terminal domain-containing protein [Saccharicrinis aurantiacus]|uniref:Wzz/FepE/Etk N-terminal domain-containing protein n=1 Tax=Saccharicrinis aurantiacus TaxID=1849719 RepID=UPI00248F5E5F|nr:Wzz/FepE/Etk N-terminal domain-containing protein [Saccharicrinis aurantiacus]